MKDKSFIDLFKFYGLIFEKRSGDEIIGDCPFSGKKDKLYVNEKTGLWDSKTAGLSGNIYNFLEYYFDLCLKNTDEKSLKPLCDSRRLPISAFAGKVAVNFYDQRFLIPTRNKEKHIIGLSLYEIGKHIFRAPTLKLAPMGIEELSISKSVPVYLCEGEWDYFALKYLFDTLSIEADVLGMPGANTFREEWVSVFENRDIVCCYDNDDAGRKGEKKVSNFLKTISFRLRFIAWPDDTPKGFDTRDFITKALKNHLHPEELELVECYKNFVNMISSENFYERNDISVNETEVPEEEEIDPITHSELENIYGHWLKMAHFDSLAIMYGTCFANRLQGDSVWMFIIAPPGGMKTELLMTLNKSPLIETVTTLTPASMISGLRSFDGKDHSLLLKINERILIIKDFTTILSGNPLGRDEVFGILRDIYDGYVEKYFAIGKKSYKSHFGILAGVTPIIDSIAGVSSYLGERFIKYRLESNLSEITEQDRIKKAISNINLENSMREELQLAGKRMMAKKVPEKLPEIDDKIIEAITDLAMFSAKMCGSVPKDKFSGEQTTKPITSIATRFSKQFMKLAMGIAVYYDHEKIGLDELRLIKIIARDTCPDRIEDLIKNLYLEGEHFQADLDWFVQKTNLSMPTILKMTQDLISLGLIFKTKGMERVKTFFILEKKFRSLVDRTGIYPKPNEKKPETAENRVNAPRISIKIKRENG